MTNLSPIHYDVHIEPDLEQFTFDGRLRLTTTTDQPLNVLNLNALDLEITQCKAYQNSEPIETKFDLEADKEILTIAFRTALVDTFTVEIVYRGMINDRMAGFYRSGYRWQGETRFMAVTQFQESDARRAFPCFDHPRYKAIFNITMIIPSDLKAFAKINE